MSKQSHGTKIFGFQNSSKYEKVFLFNTNFHRSPQKNNHLKFRQIKNVTVCILNKTKSVVAPAVQNLHRKGEVKCHSSLIKVGHVPQWKYLKTHLEHKRISRFSMLENILPWSWQSQYTISKVDLHSRVGGIHFNKPNIYIRSGGYKHALPCTLL